MIDQPGIYMIALKDSGRCYIGSSQNVILRFRQHRWSLERRRHRNKKLQHAWSKYGESAFVFSLLEITTLDLLLEREQHWMDTLKPEFNLRALAASMRGYKHSEETRRKNSEARRGVKQSPETILARTKGQLGRKASEKARMKMSQSSTGKPKSREHAAAIAASHAKTYYFTSPEGSVVEVINLNAFCKQNDLLQGSMHALWSNKIDQHRGWFRREGPVVRSAPYRLVSSTKEVVEVYNLSEFCRLNNLTRGNLDLVRIGKRRHHKGWTFAPPEDADSCPVYISQE